MADPEIRRQLVSGFYDLEGNSWRWTARQFVIIFPGLPAAGIPRRNILKADVFVPEGQIQKLGPLTLNADVNGTVLNAETFQQPGTHIYSRTVPEEALESNIVPVVFFLDKAWTPAAGEGRELGIVVSGVQLTAN